MDERWLSVMAAVGVCIILAAAYSWYSYATRSKRSIADAKVQTELDEQISAGIRTAAGNPACMVCRLTATEYMPISGSSWMDRLPLLNRLFSLPPRYVILDNIEGDLCLCRLHKGVAVRKLEEFHAALRAERAHFNAGHEERVAGMDGGELVRSVMQQHAYQIKVLRTRDTETPMPPQLQVGSKPDEEEISTSVVSGAGGTIPPEEEDEP